MSASPDHRVLCAAALSQPFQPSPATSCREDAPSSFTVTQRTLSTHRMGRKPSPCPADHSPAAAGVLPCVLAVVRTPPRRLVDVSESFDYQRTPIERKEPLLAPNRAVTTLPSSTSTAMLLPSMMAMPVPCRHLPALGRTCRDDVEPPRSLSGARNCPIAEEQRRGKEEPVMAL